METSRSDRPRPLRGRPRLLVANRGEIAARVLRGARDEGWTGIAVYSEADRRAPHLALAEEAWPIGPAPSAESYLSIPRLLEAARKARATHVHPGYGFLSENAAFAQACVENGLIWVGPPAAAIAAMGDKVSARTAAEKSGVPLIPGTPGLPENPAEAEVLAGRIGYPVLIKAAFGGGGKGMRLCRDPEDLRKGLELTRGEAGRAFGNDLIYLEKAIARPRHIEIQVLCDGYGNGVHLFERECSIQRRHQKLIEECPSTALDTETRARMGEAAVRLALGIGYESAGTVEFLFGPDGRFYFLEMNTRLQVEHPVTEMVTGVDLVRAQLRIALGEPLPWKQQDLHISGWALECRVNAEDPERGFLPGSGRIAWARLPEGPGIRNDVGFETGSEASRHYDPMLGKLIAWGRTREEARQRMLRALDEYEIYGVPTSLPFHRWALRQPAFIERMLHTGFIDELYKPEMLREPGEDELLAGVAAIARLRERERLLPAAPNGGGAEPGKVPAASDPWAPQISQWKRRNR